MKIIVQCKNGKLKCIKLNKYFKQLVDTFPNHRILKIIGVNKFDGVITENVLLMKSTHSISKWYANNDLEFDELTVLVQKKHYKKPNSNTILEE